MDATAAALSDPVRRRVLELLRDRPRTAGELAGAFSISRPAVSRHLRVLREGGLVADEARGRQRVYALRPEPLAELERWLGGLRTGAAGWGQRLDALETEVHRTCRDRRAHDTTRRLEDTA
ncbi:MAG TPA: metalloregulator ArsR/SmtB family transcription factor [Capillimicrobium sp.]|jgi:DNA-binding transcriptional ArsR family regulator